MKILAIRLLLSTFCLLAICLLSSGNAHAAIPQLINFQGKVVCANASAPCTGAGTNVPNSTYSFVFKLYTASSGGSPTFTETQSLSVTDGIFQANLNSVNGNFGTTDFTGNVWLGVAFNGDPEMTPRIQFTSSPYAINAGQLGGIASSGFVQLGPSSIQGDGSSNTSIFINKTASGNLLQFQNNGTPVYTVDNSGALTIENSTNSANILQVQNAGGEQLLNIDATNVGGNIITDPSFEAGISLWPTLGVGTPTLTSVTSNFYIGKKSLKIATNGTANEGVKYVIGAVGSVPITFSVYAQLDSGSMSTLDIGYSNDGSTLIPCLSAQTPVTAGWTRFSCNFTTASAGASAFVYVRDTGTSHTFYIDGTSAVNTATVAPFPYQNSGIALAGVITNPVTVMPTSDSVTTFQVQGGGTSNLFVADTLNNQTTINGTGGTTNIGAVGSQASASTVHIADTSGASVQTVTIGSIAARNGNVTTIQGGTAAGGAIIIQAAASGSINIATNAVATKVLNIGSVGSTAQATTIHIADSSDTSVTQVLTIGSNSGSANNVTTIQGGNTSSAITLQTAASGSVSIGANGVGGKVVNIGSVGSTAGDTAVHIGDTSATTGQAITIGSIAAAANLTTIQGGNTSSAIILQAAASGSINLATNNVATKTVNIGSVGSTAGDTAVHIGDTSNSATQAVTIGSNSAAANTTTIQGGNTSSAITIQAASAIAINIGVNAVTGKTINIGSVGSTAQATTIHIADTSAANAQTVTIGNTASNTNTLTLQGGNVADAITAQVAAGGTINLASLTSAAANVISGTVATTVNNSTTTTQLSSQSHLDITIGSDNLPFIASDNGSHQALFHCSVLDCSSSTSVLGGTTRQFNALTVGTDGLMLVLSGSGPLAFLHCGNLTCSSNNTTNSVTFGADSIIPTTHALTIGSDGLPIFAALDNTSKDLLMVHCSTITCSSYTTTLYSDARVIGTFGFSMTIGTDGLPVVAGIDGTNAQLVIYHCSTVSCSSATSVNVSAAGGGFYNTSSGGNPPVTVTIGADGMPIIASSRSSNGFDFIHCNTITCSSQTITQDNAASTLTNVFVMVGPDGLPLAITSAGSTTSYFTSKCSNVPCTSFSNTTQNISTDTISTYTGEIGADGLPVYVLYDSTANKTTVIHCGNSDCTGSSSVLSGGTSLGSANSFFQSAYIQGINTGSALNPFTIATNGITRLTVDTVGNITAATGSVFNVGAAVGSTVTCSSGNFLQTAVTTGGISTGGSCVSVGGTPSLQTNYTNSTGGSTPEIVLDTTRNGLNIQDASGTPVSGDLFDVQNNGGTFTYLGVATATISLDTAASGTINIGEANVATKTINVGSVGSTAQATTIHIADTSATTGQVLTIGSNSAGTNTTTIQGGNTAAAITLQTAASGSINIATNNVATKTINIGSVGSTAQATTIHIADTTDATTAQTLTIGSASATTNQTTLQGGTGVGAVTLATAAGGTINVGSLAFFSGSASNGVPTVIGTTTSSTTTTTKFSDADNVGQYSSEAIGSDGLPIISSYDATGGVNKLVVTHCSNISCSSSTSTKFSAAGSSDIGQYSAIAIGTDGLPIIASSDTSNSGMAFTHCSNVNCTVVTSTLLSGGFNANSYFAITIGSDGLPIISGYASGTGDLAVTHCSNVACSSSSSTKFSDTDDVGSYSSIDIGTDGFAIISHYSATNGDLVVTHCTNTACTSSGTTKISDADNVGKYSSLDIGSDGFAIISHYSTTNGDLVVTHCTNTACTSSGTTKISDADNIGLYSSLNIGSDGFAVVSSYDATGGKLDLTVTHCTNVACTSSATTKLSDSDDVGKYTFLYVGTDGLPIISHYNTTNGDLAVTHCGSVDCSTTSSTLSGGLSLGSQSNAFQKVYATGISTTDAVNPFTIATNGITRLTVDYGGNITAASGSVFNVGASTGLTATCSAGQYLANEISTGGIATGGTCTSVTAGTLQTTYTASTSPEITVDATRGALTVQDNATPIGANLLEVTANGGGTTYFGVSAASTTILGGTGSSAVSIQSGAGGSIDLSSNAVANTVQIGNTANAVAQTINIGNNATGSSTNTVKIGSTSGASVTTIQGGSGPSGNTGIILTTSTGNVVQVGAAATDTTQVLFAADSFSTFSDTASCATSTNQGALYYSTNTNSLRACISGGQSGSIWDDVVTNSVLGLQLFGVVPDSGPTPGDWVGINGTLASKGPCKVYLGSTNKVVRWTACTAFSGGRKVIIPAQGADQTVTTAGAVWNHVCIDSTTGVASVIAGGTENATTGLPTFSATAPVLCLATISTQSTAGGKILDIYDTRTFTTTTKELVNNITTAAALGWIVVQTATAGSVTPSSTTAGVGAIRGVVVATAATTTANTINAIIATAGPAYVKGTAGSVQGLVENGTTQGKAITTGTTSAVGYAIMGLAKSAFSSTCTALTDDCRGSLAVNLNIR